MYIFLHVSALLAAACYRYNRLWWRSLSCLTVCRLVTSLFYLFWSSGFIFLVLWVVNDDEDDVRLSICLSNTSNCRFLLLYQIFHEVFWSYSCFSEDEPFTFTLSESSSGTTVRANVRFVCTLGQFAAKCESVRLRWAGLLWCRDCPLKQNHISVNFI